MTTQRIAELEAEVMRLREAVDKWCRFDSRNMDLKEWQEFGRWYNSTPFTPTALNDLIEKVSEVMRERCRVELKRLDYWYSADAIRAIPNVTLEDLK